jgi:hypothetical protein
MESVGDMGQLKPDATYIYERADGVTYAREVGADPGTRQEVGWDHDPRTEDGRPLIDHLRDTKLWGDIRRAARTNPALRDALDRVIVVYELSKESEPIMHHPV